MKLIIFISLILIVSNLFGNDLSGKVYYPFLRVYTDAKSSALGKTAPAVISDRESYGVNPALLSLAEKEMIQTSYLHMIEDIHLGSVSYQSYFKKQPYSVTLKYISYGDFDGRDELGNSIGNPSASDIMLSFAHGRMLTDRLSLGLAAGFVYSNLDGSKSSGLVFSGGMLYQTGNRGNFAVVLLNQGIVFSKYLEDDESNMPWQITAGWSKKLEHLPATVTANYSILKEDDQYVHGGLIVHFNPSFNVRAGYYLSAQESLAFSMTDDDNKHGMSFGCDFQMNSWKVVFALTPFGKLGNNKQFMITYEY